MRASTFLTKILATWLTVIQSIRNIYSLLALITDPSASVGIRIYLNPLHRMLSIAISYRSVFLYGVMIFFLPIILFLILFLINLLWLLLFNLIILRMWIILLIFLTNFFNILLSSFPFVFFKLILNLRKNLISFI